MVHPFLRLIRCPLGVQSFRLVYTGSRSLGLGPKAEPLLRETALLTGSYSNASSIELLDLFCDDCDGQLLGENPNFSRLKHTKEITSRLALPAHPSSCHAASLFGALGVPGKSNASEYERFCSTQSDSSHED